MYGKSEVFIHNLTFYLPVVAAFLKVWTLLNPVVEGSKCLAHLLKERIE